MQGEQEKKYFAMPDSKLNSDDAGFALGTNEWCNLENIRFETDDNETTKQGQFIGGTLLLSNPQPSVNYMTIGTCSDDENGVLVRCQFNTTGVQDKIVAYYKGLNTEFDVLLSSQVTGGLNFDKNSLIHSCFIINGMFYWVAGTNNQPRKINLESAIKANNPSFVTDATPYTFPLNFSEITLIKPPPLLAANVAKLNDAAFLNNFIKDESFECVFRYTYYDNETTVVGTYSPASRLNTPAEDYNVIKMSMDFREFIPSTVRFVDLIVRLSNTNNAFIVKTWDREVPADSTEISNQNNQVSVLAFNFYNDRSGEYLANGENGTINQVLKPFDSVPIYSETAAAARNRAFLGNNTEGYDTPLLTSLSFTPITFNVGSSSITKNAISIEWTRYNIIGGGTPNYTGRNYGGWYVYLTEVLPVGYYFINGTDVNAVYTGASSPRYPSLPAPPSPVAFSGLTFQGATLTDVLFATDFFFYSSAFQFGGVLTDTSSFIINITGLNQTVFNAFAAQSPYQGGIWFGDFAGRRCGVVTKEGLIFTTDARDFDFSTITTGVNWSLSNANAVNEIPDWAYYYWIGRTLNLRTRFFIDSYSDALKYVQKDADNNYVFNSNLFVTGAIGIGLNTQPLNQSGLGYVYSEGDQCILIKSDDTRYQLPVIGQDGNYIIVKADNIGDLSGATWVYEIYTPHKTSTQEPFFDMGEVYIILNPGTPNRQYETLNGTLLPDSYTITRNYNLVTYVAGAMSPNDLFYKRWDNDGGKVNLQTKLGQVVKTQYIRWSDTFLPNTSVNGLSTFDFNSQIPIPEDCGDITKLINTSKVQSEGSVMLCLCANETNSIYLGEGQQFDATGQTLYYNQTGGVIGAVNTLKGSYGTVNPESVVSYRGAVYWFSLYTRRIVQYASNGLFPISNYKMVRFWNLFSQLYESLSVSDIEALGARPFVFGMVDPYHNELLFSIPKLSNTPPKGFLPDYPNKIYPFDIFDAQGKTIVYKLDTGSGQPKWLGAFSFNPEYFASLQNDLYACKYGHLYIHNQSANVNEFYGVQYSSKIMIVANQLPSKPKMYNNISSQSNLVPSFVYFYNQNPIQQSSDLVDNDFVPKEGAWFTTIKRNKLVPTAAGYTTDGLLTGEKMRNAAMFILLEWRVGSEPLELEFVNIGYNISKGIPT